MSKYTFDSYEEASAIVHDESMVGTYRWLAAMNYCKSKWPKEVQEQFNAMTDESFAQDFPDLQPDSVSEDGTLYYSAEKLREALGMGQEEFYEACRKLSEIQEGSGHMLPRSSAKLQRVQ